ncbi:MAG: MurT ligase domain-containing protein [Acidimicrobiales bacterium]
MNIRTRAAVVLGRGLGEASRRWGRGGGTVIGGRITTALDPRALARLSLGYRTILVSGTNGKTTTTRLLSSALATSGATVVTNSGGANMPAGLVAALSAGRQRAGDGHGRPGQAGLAALEVDEGWLGTVMDATRPAVVVLLNLSRDQMDRVSEVRMTASKWRQALARCPDVSVVANADDPMVVWAASTGTGAVGSDEGDAGGIGALGSDAAPTGTGAVGSDEGDAGGRRVLWVGAGQPWRADSSGCPQCQGRLDFNPLGADVGWSCRCGLRRPEPDVWIENGRLVWPSHGGAPDSTAPLGHPAGSDPGSWPIDLGLPGQFNRSNAAMALAGAGLIDPSINVARALGAMASTRDIAGRYQVVEVGAGRARLLMAKNPAGWVEMFDLLSHASPATVVLAINSRLADGRDPSWLWDVPFEALAGRPVVASGERCWDLAVRLSYAGVPHRVVADPRAALRQAASVSGATLDFVGNYTAFQDVRRSFGFASA